MRSPTPLKPWTTLPVAVIDPNHPQAVLSVLQPLLPANCMYARDWQAAGNKWAPQASFMVCDRNSLLAAFVTLAHYGQHALTFHAGTYSPGSLTLEVQFSDAGAGAVAFYNRLPEKMDDWHRLTPSSKP